MRELYYGYVSLRILYSERGYCERNEEEVIVGVLYIVSLHLLDNKKEGPGNFYGGRSLH
jgi:hypothetical protein